MQMPPAATGVAFCIISAYLIRKRQVSAFLVTLLSESYNPLVDFLPRRSTDAVLSLTVLSCRRNLHLLPRLAVSTTAGYAFRGRLCHRGGCAECICKLS